MQNDASTRGAQSATGQSQTQDVAAVVTKRGRGYRLVARLIIIFFFVVVIAAIALGVAVKICGDQNSDGR
jgi:hypothetical protein